MAEYLLANVLRVINVTWHSACSLLLHRKKLFCFFDCKRFIDCDVNYHQKAIKFFFSGGNFFQFGIYYTFFPCTTRLLIILCLFLYVGCPRDNENPIPKTKAWASKKQNHDSFAQQGHPMLWEYLTWFFE